MKIYVDDERYKKDLVDLFRIFTKEGIDFVCEDQAQIIIKNNTLKSNKESRFQDKLDLKRILYQELSDKYSYQNPWGLVTGTKPQKLYNKYDEKFLSDKYMIQESKLSMLRQIGKWHENIAFSKDNLHLYINIPFCPTRCTYCSFPTIIYKTKDRRDEYLVTLLKEIRAFSDVIKDRNLRTIYIGGGTPSALTLGQMKLLLETIRQEFDLSKLEEFTLEAGREDTLDEEKLKLMRDFGVDRISINPQSFNRTTIEKIERNQDLTGLLELYKIAKELGFIINMDLILGLEDESIKEIMNSFDYIESLRPENLTVHTLSLKRGAKLKEVDPDYHSDQIEDMVDYSQKRASELGYKAYYLYRQKEILGNFENVGYCLNTPSLYNIVSNEELESILGLGMTSNSKIYVGNRIYKHTNHKNLDDYIGNLDQMIEKKINLLRGAI